MVSLVLSAEESLSNPLDLLEDFAHANEWSFERPSDSELAMQLVGTWVDFHLWFVWHEDLEAVYFACHFETEVSDSCRAGVQDLIALMNERLWLGHFELGQDGATMLFRHTVPLRGTGGMSLEQLEDLMEAAITECDRFYPALQLVLWNAKPARDAMMATMMDTVGHA